MKRKVTCSYLLISLAMFGLADRSYGQTKELKKIRLNVFRTDAATVAAKGK